VTVCGLWLLLLLLLVLLPARVLLLVLLLLLLLCRRQFICQVSQEALHLACYCCVVEVMCARRVVCFGCLAQHGNRLVIRKPCSVWIIKPATEQGRSE
jgi:hypothetical protein